MVIYNRYGLRGRLLENTRVVRFRRQFLRQQIITCVNKLCLLPYRQRCSVHDTILPLLAYLTLPVENFFSLAGVFLAKVRWTWTLLSGVKVGENAWEYRSETRQFCILAFSGLRKRFPVGMHVTRPKDSSTRTHFFLMN